MLLDAFPRPDDTNWSPLRTTPATRDEGFDAAFAASRAPDGFAYYNQALYDRYARAIELHRMATGEVLQNPLRSDRAWEQPPRDEVEAQRRALDPVEREDEVARRRADVDARLIAGLEKFGAVMPDAPDPRNFDADIAAEARALRAEAARTGQSAPLGAFMGGAAGELTHPLNVLTLPLGAGPVTATARGVLSAAAIRVSKTAAIEGAIAGGSQAAIEMADLPTRSRLGTAPSSREMLADVGMAVVGGAVLGGTLRALAESVRLLGSEASRIERDAAAVAQEQMARQGAKPAGMDQAVHDANTAQAVQSVLLGDLPSPVAAPVARRAVAVAQGAGGPATVYTANGRAVEVELQAVELSTLIASNRADLSPNPAFPAELQPRDRTRAASAAQVAEIAGRLEPERLGPGSDAATGAPIVGPDNVVESGNGRVLALGRAYSGIPERATAYRDYVVKLAPEASSMSQPVLIRRRTTPLLDAERAAFTREANESTAARLAPTEQAVADAKLLDGRLDLYQGGDLNLDGNRPLVRAFLADLTPSERGALVGADGRLNADGLRRLERAMLARAYGDPTLVSRIAEDQTSDIVAIGKALTDVAAGWAKMREAAGSGQINPAMDVTADLLASVRMIEQARQKGVKVGFLAAQADMFDLTDNGRALLGLFFRDADKTHAAGRTAMVERLNAYLDESMKSQPGVNLFGEAPPGADTVLALVARRAREADDAARRTAEGMRPEALEAAMVDAVRVANDMQAKIMVPDADGNLVERTAAEVLSEAETQLNVARTIEGCAYGAI